ncbi:hypothetical protein GCM10011504_50920 [Siccirubricoccus deserti]|uniref:Uncharacterized protein n=1 Tax=Siccirubricoccus deserti TaxID=2013562 RepID=A0A9X0R2J5_9PROT|nr:hypothetical protein [Siccirubricoccus deserti]MBC4018554.1 hypothetical protein [Siccirubricoccus deserti]GGC66750.1 hypothetical protein GCM10011504_50920 [Siccirubricoccus deserti]
MAQQGKESAPPDDNRHERARDLGEAALGKLAEGREAEADQLIEKAKRLDKSALKEIVEDLDEDAGSNPDAAKRAPG